MALSIENQLLLTQLRRAYADLISGRLVSEITANGRTKKFQQADKAELRNEIARLEALADQPVGTPRRGAIRFSL